MSTFRRRRWLDVLRRSSEAPGRAARTPASPLDEASLWTAHEQASKALETSSAIAERIAGAMAKQRTVIDAAAERAGLVAARSSGLMPTSARLTETFERLGVVALNAGLEGSRTLEPQGRALLLLSEEIRANVARGVEAARELTGATEDLANEAGGVRRQIDAFRGEVADVGDEAARLVAATQDAARAMGDLAERLRKATGVDPETARALALASEHARGLMTALTALTTAAPSGSALEGLKPIVMPLARLLGELSDGEGSSGSTPPGDDDS